MGRPRKSPSMTDGKREIISRLIEEYDIKTAEDIQDALRDLLGGTIQGMMECEMEAQKEEHQAYDPEYHDSRNGYKPKTLRSNYGSVDIRVPQDRNSDYEPRIVPKYSRDISEIDEKIIRMYARGMSTRQISDQIMDIYGFEVSEALVTDVTNKILPEIESWQKRPLCAVYPIVYIDAIVFNVRDNGIIRKQAAYVILGISEEGHKEVLSITIGESESAKFWLSVLNELKNRGVKDIFVLCADGLTGIGDAIAAAFPMTEYQRCIVHMVRNTLKYVADKDRKEFANDLKTIYHAPDEEQGYRNMQVVAEKWDKK
jgi:putative transposase